MASVEFIDKIVAERYKVRIPIFLAKYHDWWDTWEKCRFYHMEEHLTTGDILFDVGSEVGWISAIYAQFVGAENMCMFEPFPKNWINIRDTWIENRLPNPKSMRCTLVSDHTHVPPGVDFDMGYDDFGWPNMSKGEHYLSRSFRYIHMHADNTPQLALDDFVEQTGIRPYALTIDVEGAELKVLQGAKKILLYGSPLVWVSVHPEMMRKDYDVQPELLFDFMDVLGYNKTFLGNDHEYHYFFERSK